MKDAEIVTSKRRFWSPAAALPILVALGACGSWTPPVPPPVVSIPVHPGRADGTPRAQSEPPAALSGFAALRERVLSEWLAEDPSLGRTAGLHRYDGKVPSFSAAAIRARLARLEKVRAELAAVDRSGLSADEALDLALLLNRADMVLFQGKDTEEWRHRPQAYEELFSVNAYLDRDYLPVAERAESLLAHEEAALAQVPHIRENLVSPMSRPVVETAVKIFKGYAEYLRNDVPKQLKGVGTKEFQDKLARVNEALAVEATRLSEHLAKVELKKGDNSHVLGPERYKRLLKVQEGLDIPLSELKKMGEDNLAQNKKAYEELIRKNVKLTRPTEAALFDEAARLTEEARKFVLEKKLVTIPTDDRAVVKESPPFMRWNAAFLEGPGPFEQKPMSAFYYITRPDPTWPKKEQEEYITPLGILLSTTIHEVYPGHFLQAQWVKRAPTRVQKILSSYSFVEGWAHYGEQVMIEEGFGAADPQNHLGQLSDALLRNCRVVVSLGIHAEKMSLAQAERRFVNDCKQDKATAREQAARGTFDPGFFAYTLGKIQILALRDEAKKRLGARFSLQRFHDAGAPGSRGEVDPVTPGARGETSRNPGSPSARRRGRPAGRGSTRSSPRSRSARPPSPRSGPRARARTPRRWSRPARRTTRGPCSSRAGSPPGCGRARRAARRGEGRGSGRGSPG
jgi:uncharacterized protein (DUF885 family)